MLQMVLTTGFVHLTVGNLVMWLIAFVFLYLAISKNYEPLLLVPIGFGILVVNLPLTGLMKEGQGLLWNFYHYGLEWEIIPPLIFLGLGALTDFGPVIANPKTLLLGAGAQFGVYVAFFGALLCGFSIPEACAIGIIGGADGPTTIYTTIHLAPNILGATAVAAYSYMSLVPIIQPPIMRLLTTRNERRIKMKQLRRVSKREKIIFPLIAVIIICLIVPASSALMAMFMLGNLFRESGVVKRLSDAASNELMNIVTILLGVSVGATMSAESFLTPRVILIFFLGLLAFAFSTAAGVALAKLMNLFSKDKINPLIGSAGVSAVPMAARVSQIEGAKEDPSNYLLMHAMGPNVAGTIGTVVAAGVFLSIGLK
ncbi:MAG: glutaconyl-CoA decarboxylase subunit beta [Deltaproteobacteria bacterium]|nr:MAG: glutaconyl-CoA decarboxylase subunit beta [Deltaproteobacteria bacterium]